MNTLVLTLKPEGGVLCPKDRTIKRECSFKGGKFDNICNDCLRSNGIENDKWINKHGSELRTILCERDEDGKMIPYRRTEEKIGRNEKCPCGSDKKYKHCCLQGV